MAVMTGLGALLGGLSNTQAARTGTNSSTTNQSQYGSTTPTFTTTQQGLQGSTAAALNNEMTNGINTTPMANAGTDQINQTYKGIGDRLQQSLSERGFGNSGASGTAALQTEVGREGAVGSLQSQLQSYALQQQQNAIGQATGFAFAAPGSTSTGSTTGTTNGTYTLPGSVAAGSLSGGLTALNSGTNQGLGILAALNASGG